MTESVLLSHGDGGELTRQLLEQIFLRRFNEGEKTFPADAHIFEITSGRAALTTDSFVIRPLFFPEEISASSPSAAP